MSKSILAKALDQIVSDRGRDALLNGILIINLFADYCPQAINEKAKLKKAYDSNVIQELIKNTNGQKDASAAVNKAIQDLKDKAFMDEKIATAFIYEIAEVLKLKYTPKPVSAPVVTSPTTKVTPPPSPKVSSATNAQNSKQPESTQRTPPTDQQRASSRQQMVTNKPNFKIIGIIAVLAVVVAVLLTAALFGGGDEKNPNYCTFELSDDRSYYIVTGYEGIETSVTIPSEYKGKPVKSIGEFAFSGCTISSITIPDSVTTIEEKAFDWCMQLTDVTIGCSVTRIGSYAFNQCKSLQSVTFKDNSQLIEICAYAFIGCKALTNITLPSTVTSMAKGSFGGCSALRKIVIPKSVTTMAINVFGACDSLVIYCELASRPEGWSEYWNADDRPVIWGYTGG